MKRLFLGFAILLNSISAMQSESEAEQTRLNQMVCSLTEGYRDAIKQNVKFETPKINSEFFGFNSSNIWLTKKGMENPSESLNVLLTKESQYSCRHATDILKILALRDILGNQNFNKIFQEAKNPYVASNVNSITFQQMYIEDTTNVEPGVFAYFINLPGQDYRAGLFIDILNSLMKVKNKEISNLLNQLPYDRSFAPYTFRRGENVIITEGNKIWGHGVKHTTIDPLLKDLLKLYYRDLQKPEAVEFLKIDPSDDLKHNGYQSKFFIKHYIKTRKKLLQLSEEQFSERFLPLMEYTQRVYKEVCKYDQISAEKLKQHVKLEYLLLNTASEKFESNT